MSEKVIMSRWRDEIARIRSKFGCGSCEYADQQCVEKNDGCCTFLGGPKYDSVAGKCARQSLVRE